MKEEYVSVPKSKLLKLMRANEELSILVRKLRKDVEKLKKKES